MLAVTHRPETVEALPPPVPLTLAPPSPIEQVLGFAFSTHGAQVLLIRKNRPEWQAGKLNGIGGKIEPGEMPDEAMAREFREETGLETSKHNWQQFLTYSAGSHGTLIHCFTTRDLSIGRARSLTDEVVSLHMVGELEGPAVPSLSWLLPMAHFALFHERLIGMVSS